MRETIERVDEWQEHFATEGGDLPSLCERASSLFAELLSLLTDAGPVEPLVWISQRKLRLLSGDRGLNRKWVHVSPFKHGEHDQPLYLQPPVQPEVREDEVNDGDGVKCRCEWQDPMTGDLMEDYPAILDPSCNVPHKEPAVQPEVVAWVPVEERMPEEYQDVLVCVRYHESFDWEVTESSWDQHNGWLMGSAENYELTHWMPLPALPSTHSAG